MHTQLQTYVHLSLTERERMFGFIQQGKSLRSIARILGRSHTTLTREIQRNSQYGRAYLPHKAQRRYERITTRQRKKVPLKHIAVYLYVRTHLRKRYSPEQIAGRIRIAYPTDQDMRISPEAIYQYIYATAKRRRDFVPYLTRRQKVRRKQIGRSVQKVSRITDAIALEKRPTPINIRSRIGHYETDLIESTRSCQHALSVTVERKTRYTILTKVHNKTADEKTRAIRQRFDQLPQRIKKSITIDNGSENTRHTQWGIHTTYVCRPYHSWEKGTVENMNGRIRVTFPKGTDFSLYTEAEIQALEDRLNNTPRKCLGYLTPKEALLQFLHIKQPSRLRWCTSK